ncbi:MAG: hypothetical protein PHD21_06725 [Flavobacteriales bacterium]|nr:hypothetical protein [Flavobacteriales bacterium]
MNKKLINTVFATVCSLTVAVAQNVDTTSIRAQNDTITSYLREKNGPSMGYIGKVRVDSIRQNAKTTTVYYAPTMAQYALRKESCDHVYSILKATAPNADIKIVCEGKEINDLVPSFFNTTKKAKTSKNKANATQLVTPLDRPYTPLEGLSGKHIALWQSHGYYYEQKLLRWEWQRARIFQTVEDLYTQSYVLPFLVPMLERAGAVVMLPRERDTQTEEVIADNDAMSGYFEKNGKYSWAKGDSTGFANPKKYYTEGENPFTMGSYRQVSTIAKGAESVATWNPTFDKEGQYAVYVSYKTLPQSATDATYTVYHKGGKTSFRVNQTMGGGTWIYLGTFDFAKGNDAKIELSNKSGKEGRIITADAVKIGGGMGNIARTPAKDTSKVAGDARRALVEDGYTPEPIISGYPRFTEGARYFMQWAGFPSSVYSRFDGQDYTDDYGGRGPWVNYLLGGTQANPDEKGLGIPVDMSFAFHTDAGTKYGDDIVGTLMIYTLKSDDKTTFPNGTSRYANRNVADIIQTQIVDDIRATADPQWTRRQLMNGNYAESRTPKEPAALLELLSHQNFSDMRFGLDPRFRFTVSRAIYKGMLKFLASQSGRPYVVQPLPVEGFSTEFVANDKVKLAWTPVEDSLEATAKPTSYIVYTRVDGGAFDAGVVVKNTEYTVSVTPGQIYSYKVTAVNAGGESFDSEILSAYRAVNEKGMVMIVNGFDRVSAPQSFASPDSTFAGFQDGKDHGVPYIKDISYIGSQHEFRRNIPWMDDDSAGFGASDGDYETMVIAGNTFDYPQVHGLAMAQKGYSFVSCSRKAVEKENVDLKKYKVVDIIMGKQRQSVLGHNRDRIDFPVYTSELIKAITEYTQNGGNILISGAYVGTDVWDSEKGFKKDTEGMDFATKVLKYRWMTDSAARTGRVQPTTTPLGYLGGKYTFAAEPNTKMYCVESPDGITPVGKKAYSIMRYSENNISAAVAYNGNDYKTVVVGFPIETICSESERTEFIGKILDFFVK